MRNASARLDRNGDEVAPLDHAQVREALALFKAQGVEAVAICFMNSYANPSHERAAARIVEAEFPEAYLTVSSDLLPSIRFYERVSTTALNAYIGPILDRYLEQLSARLGAGGFQGVLLIMQSNGGVMSPEVARKKAALTLLSGPAGGPVAGLAYASVHGLAKAIVVDMGGTSFEAALVIDDPVMVNEGQIDRLRIALPMLAINTIGAGGGSIGWLDEGGLLRVGPQSAGADPGPVSYGKGGTLPTITDANLVLGYLNQDFFAGGKMQLDAEAARLAIESHIAKPLGLTVGQAAAGMYRVACNNMAQGVRAVTIARGRDPREFPMVVAGGAGPIHSCLISDELGIGLQIVPRESSILCAVGMLLSDLKHDFVRTYVARLDNIDWPALLALIEAMRSEGGRLLETEGVAEAGRRHFVKFDCRYLKQYHEVSFVVPDAALTARDASAIAQVFHGEHDRLYGYALAEEATPVEVVNVRLQSVGEVDKPALTRDDPAGPDASGALKSRREVYIFEEDGFAEVPVYDGHALHHGNRIIGPAMIEEVTTAIFVSASYDCEVDATGSFVLRAKGQGEPGASPIGEEVKHG